MPSVWVQIYGTKTAKINWNLLHRNSWRNLNKYNFAQVPENKRAEPNGERSTDAEDRSTDAAVSLSLDASSSFHRDVLSQSEGLPEAPTSSSADLDSFSDSFTHMAPSCAEPAASVLNTETLGRVDLPQEEERLSHEGVHHLTAEGLQEEGLPPDQCQATAAVENQAGRNKKNEVAAQSGLVHSLVGKCAVCGPVGFLELNRFQRQRDLVPNWFQSVDLCLKAFLHSQELTFHYAPLRYHCCFNIMIILLGNFSVLQKIWSRAKKISCRVKKWDKCIYTWGILKCAVVFGSFLHKNYCASWHCSF